MNEKLNKNAKVEQLIKMFLSHGEEKGLIVKGPLNMTFLYWIPLKLLEKKGPSEIRR